MDMDDDSERLDQVGQLSAEQDLVSRLFTFLTELGDAESLDLQLRLVAGGLSVVVPGALGGMALVDETGTWTIVWQAKGELLDVPPELIEQLEPLHRLAAETEGLFIATREGGPAAVSVPPIFEARRIRRLAVGRLETRHRDVGVLFVGREAGRPFSPAEQLAVRAIARQTAFAVEHLRLTRSLARESDDLDGQAARSLQAALDEAQAMSARLEDENAYLRAEMQERADSDEIVGRSPAVVHLRQAIETVAPTSANVLISGERGTEPELVARAIHRLSPRQGRALIVVDCTAIPPEGWELELFGDSGEGGRDRVGRVRRAHEGTLCLNEVGAIPVDLQSRLLAALHGEPAGIGNTPAASVDIRAIATTTRDLRAEVDAGRFREDLYYQLNVFPIELAPLRRRRDDIPLLAAHYLAEAARRFDRPEVALTSADAHALRAGHWVGNDRELALAVERAVLTSRNGRLRFALPVETDDGTAVAGGAGAVQSEADMRRAQRDNLEAALRRTGWKIYGPDGAATLLGMKPTTLASRIKKAGVKKPDR